MKEITVIDAARAVFQMNRVGVKAGRTNIAKALECTVPRAAKLLKLSVGHGLVSTYDHNYRPNVPRCCYAITDCGQTVLAALRDHEVLNYWSGENVDR